jgi:hypothetical protein
VKSEIDAEKMDDEFVRGSRLEALRTEVDLDKGRSRIRDKWKD